MVDNHFDIVLFFFGKSLHIYSIIHRRVVYGSRMVYNIEQCNDCLNKVIEELVRLQMVTSMTKIKVFEMFINLETPIFDDDKLFFQYILYGW